VVIVTSFHHSQHFSGDKYSLTPHQPLHYNYQDISCVSPLTCDGSDIRTSKYVSLKSREDFLSSAETYRQLLMGTFLERLDEIQYLIEALPVDRNIILCSWAPYNNSARQQLKRYGKFVCHSGLVAGLILSFRQDLTVVLDRDRSELLLEPWHHGVPNEPLLF
jgi:hypothetical protein